MQRISIYLHYVNVYIPFVENLDYVQKSYNTIISNFFYCNSLHPIWFNSRTPNKVDIVNKTVMEILPGIMHSCILNSGIKQITDYMFQFVCRHNRIFTVVEK